MPRVNIYNEWSTDGWGKGCHRDDIGIGCLKRESLIIQQ